MESILANVLVLDHVSLLSNLIFVPLVMREFVLGLRICGKYDCKKYYEKNDKTVFHSDITRIMIF